MTVDDEKALGWDEVSDPTHVSAASRVEPVETPERVEPVETAKPATSSFLLVSYGILAGAYLLYTVGWVLGIGHVNGTNPDALSKIMGVVTQALAIGAPAIWYAGSFVLTRGRRPIVRLLLLVAGLAATIPLPFIFLGATA
jgi:hypothetical protein